jgi:hypothetical protein
MTIVGSCEISTSSSQSEDSALLGISPNDPIGEASLTSLFLNAQKKQIQSSKQQHGFSLTTKQTEEYDVEDNNDEPPPMMFRRPRSGSEGLDCLAALAEQERSRMISSSSDEEEDAAAVAAMPPPPSRRPRSVSNPEGMDQYCNKQQFRLVIPESILEEELAEVSRAVENAERPDNLLKNARARILEDVALEKGLPHTLSKYKHVSGRCTGIESFCMDVMFSRISRSEMLSSTLGLDLQPRWTYWNLHTSGTCCNSGARSRQAHSTELEQENPIQLPKVPRRSTGTHQGTIRKTIRTRSIDITQTTKSSTTTR